MATKCFYSALLYEAEFQKSLVHLRQSQVCEKRSICFKSTLCPSRRLGDNTRKNSLKSTEAKEAMPGTSPSALTWPHFISFNLQKGNEMITFFFPKAELSRIGLRLKTKHSMFFIKEPPQRNSNSNNGSSERWLALYYKVWEMKLAVLVRRSLLLMMLCRCLLMGESIW